jgi:type I restriction enzyme S subunit
MSEIFEIRNGYTPSKANFNLGEGGTLPWFRMKDIRQNSRILSDSIQYITLEAVKRDGLFSANSIILATTATIGEHALILIDSLANQRFTFLIKRKSFGKVEYKIFLLLYVYSR